MVTKRKPNKKGSADAPAIRVGASQPARSKVAKDGQPVVKPAVGSVSQAKQASKVAANLSPNPMEKPTPKSPPKPRPSVKPAAKAKAKTVAAAQAFVKVKDAELEEAAPPAVVPPVKESSKPTVKNKAVAKPKPARRSLVAPDIASQDDGKTSESGAIDRVGAGFAQKYRMATNAYSDNLEKKDSSSPIGVASEGDIGALDEDASTQAKSGEGEESATDETDDDTSSLKSAKTTKKRHWLRWVVLALLAIVLVAVSSFSWDRWFRYNDAREFTGEWQVDGTARTIVIDDTSIKLTDDVSYAYQLDSTAKTITFSFGNMSGAGRYRFSADRTQLLIDDSGTPSALTTLFDDIAWTWDATLRAAQGKEQIEFLAAEGLLALDWVSDDASALPRDLTPVVSDESDAEPDSLLQSSPDDNDMTG